MRVGDQEHELMLRAIACARVTRRHTAPRPAVGCVIVRDGVVVGEGATGPLPHGSHAEVAALRAAGDRARGATAYVTLEPCNHHGSTWPCTDALLEAGIGRVVVALGDPDRRVSGAGFARLAAAGLDVVTGVAASEAARDLAPYLYQRRTGRAYVTAKVALSLDGRVAAADGSSQWITSAAARADAHELRADAHAIVIGSGTALADAPALTVRDVDDTPDHPPLRVLLDARGRVPATGPLFDPSLAPTLVFTTELADARTIDAWQDAGAKVESVAAVPTGRGGVDLDAVLAHLAGEGVLEALVEGGGVLLGALIERRDAQRLVTYVAPALLGTSGRPGFAFAGPDSLGEAEHWEILDVRRLGADVRIEMVAAA